MPTASSNVRVGGQSGKHVLLLSAGERVPPGFLASSVAGVRLGTVAAVAMLLALGHRALLGQGTKYPPCRVRSAGRVTWRGSLRCGLGGVVPVSSLLGAHLRAHLCLRVPPRPGLKF